MTENFLKEVCEELHRLDIDFLLVGGSAIVDQIDFVLTPKEFDEIEERLEKNSRFIVRDSIKTMVGTEFMYENSWRTVEFINPTHFSGNKTADEFVEYVKRYRSKKTDIGHIANPEIVFFMRLMVNDWEIYIQKILRDIKAGLPLDILNEVMAISKTLGVEEKMNPRIEKTREIISDRI